MRATYHLGSLLIIICTRCVLVKIREVPVDRWLSLATPPLHLSVQMFALRNGVTHWQPIGSQAAWSNKLGPPIQWMTLQMTHWNDKQNSKWLIESLIWSISFSCQSNEPKMVLPFFECFSLYLVTMGADLNWLFWPDSFLVWLSGCSFWLCVFLNNSVRWFKLFMISNLVLFWGINYILMWFCAHLCANYIHGLWTHWLSSILNSHFPGLIG